MVEINGKIENTFNYDLCPFGACEYDPEALNVNRKTVDEIKEFPSEEMIYDELIDKFQHFINRYNKNDKFVLAGFGIDFDYAFLRKLFERHNEYGAGSWIFNCTYDVRTIAAMAIMNKNLRINKYRLGDFCQFFGIKLEAHDAMSDILATYELNRELIKYIKS